MATGPITGNQYEISGGTPAHRAARALYWSEMAENTIPVGSVVVGIKYQMESEGDPLIITIKKPNNSIVVIVPMRDDEANGPGALHTWEDPRDGDEDIHKILPTLS
jgi:hypothetical protein